NHLDESSGGDGVRSTDGGPAVGERVERVSGPVDAPAEVDSGAGDDVSEEGKHRDTSVLELDESEAVESLLVGVVKEAERIVESKRLLDSELTLEGIELGGGLAGLGRGEGGGRADEGEGGNRLHGGLRQVVRLCVGVRVRSENFRAEDPDPSASNCLWTLTKNEEKAGVLGHRAGDPHSPHPRAMPPHCPCRQSTDKVEASTIEVFEARCRSRQRFPGVLRLPSVRRRRASTQRFLAPLGASNNSSTDPKRKRRGRGERESVCWGRRRVMCSTGDVPPCKSSVNGINAVVCRPGHTAECSSFKLMVIGIDSPRDRSPRDPMPGRPEGYGGPRMIDSMPGIWRSPGPGIWRSPVSHAGDMAAPGWFDAGDMAVPVVGLLSCQGIEPRGASSAFSHARVSTPEGRLYPRVIHDLAKDWGYGGSRIQFVPVRARARRSPGSV
ncbi:hypothetical protein THAOC_34005, partial [Thalassiosira oceanica]